MGLFFVCINIQTMLPYIIYIHSILLFLLKFNYLGIDKLYNLY